LYKELAQKADGSSELGRVSFVWAVRSAAEAAWAFSSDHGIAGVGVGVAEADSSAGVHVYVSGTEHHVSSVGARAMRESIELQTPLRREHGGKAEALKDDEDDDEDGELSVPGVRVHQGRPQLRRFVDEVFMQGADERIAVLFCGPPAMGRALRAEVGRWVKRGRELWWWTEEFGW
jgi:hypothetical protein